MKKIIMLLALMVLTAVIFCGCSENIEEENDINPNGFDYDMIDFSLIADGIYANLDISKLTSGSVEKITDETVLSEQFYLDMDNVITYEVRSAEGKYGVADIAIIRVKEGKADEVMDSLENRKDDRINEFLRYDVYNSYATAMNAEIYQAGELVVMLMLSDDDKAKAKEIIDYYMP